jgi:hypothetical protein
MNEPTVRRHAKFLDAGLRGYLDGVKGSGSTQWAQALTRQERETYVRVMAPVVQQIQSRLAACRRLNNRTAPDVPATRECPPTP